MRSMIRLALIVPPLALVGCEDPVAGPNPPGLDGSVPASEAGATYNDGQPADGAVAGAALAADLQYLREEEKLARDVYRALHAKWKTNIFNNIAKSEQQHTDAVKALLAARGIPDPVSDDTVGVFKDSNLAGLYKTLTAKGSVSEVEALIVGATIEDLDIEDIEQMKSRTSDQQALALYDRLQCGSRNHLRSFIARLTARGGAYTAQYISTATYNTILQGASENCGR